MASRVLGPDASGMDAAAAALGNGAVVALPTDTVYGLAVLPVHPGALAGLFAMKRRPPEVAVPVLIGAREQVAEVAGPLGPAAGRLARRHWPGPLTLVVPRAPDFDADLGGPPSAGTVGLRWPDHAVVESLCRRVGPLAVTSANLHGHPPATTAADVIEAFGGIRAPAVVLDGGVCDGVPSTVVECRGWSARCLRRGALSWQDLAPGSDTAGGAESGWTDLRRVPPPSRGLTGRLGPATLDG